jgi:hypothetical protein
MYAIFDGTHYNGGCCFDYGNAERNSRDNGNGTIGSSMQRWTYTSSRPVRTAPCPDQQPAG